MHRLRLFSWGFSAKKHLSILAHPEKYHVDGVIKLGNDNVGRSEKTLTLPLYMGSCRTRVERENGEYPEKRLN